MNTVQNGKGGRRRPTFNWSGAKPSTYVFARDREANMGCKKGKKGGKGR